MQPKTTPIESQQSFWNEWNASYREKVLAEVSLEQADIVVSWLRELGRSDLTIIDVGCGTGWLCSKLTQFGHVTGTDLSDEVLARAAQRVPTVRFLAGNFMALDFGVAIYDVAISLEVLSHVDDQLAFVQRISRLLKPGGNLIIATQNRTALERNAIPPPKPGQIRSWIDHLELRRLLEKDFVVERLFSITPQFNRGPLRIVNSYKWRHLAGAIGLGEITSLVKKLQEDAWLGWTLMALGRRRFD